MGWEVVRGSMVRRGGKVQMAVKCATTSTHSPSPTHLLSRGVEDVDELVVGLLKHLHLSPEEADVHAQRQ